MATASADPHRRAWASLVRSSSQPCQAAPCCRAEQTIDFRRMPQELVESGGGKHEQPQWRNGDDVRGARVAEPRSPVERRKLAEVVPGAERRERLLVVANRGV